MFHAASILSVPSVWRSCDSRAGSAEGELSEETSEGGWLDEWESFTGLPPSRSSGWARSGTASPCTILRYYDMTVMMDCRMWNENIILFLPSVLVAAVVSDSGHSADLFLGPIHSLRRPQCQCKPLRSSEHSPMTE